MSMKAERRLFSSTIQAAVLRFLIEEPSESWLHLRRDAHLNIDEKVTAEISEPNSRATARRRGQHRQSSMKSAEIEAAAEPLVPRARSLSNTRR